MTISFGSVDEVKVTVWRRPRRRDRERFPSFPAAFPIFLAAAPMRSATRRRPPTRLTSAKAPGLAFPAAPGICAAGRPRAVMGRQVSDAGGVLTEYTG